MNKCHFSAASQIPLNIQHTLLFFVGVDIEFEKMLVSIFGQDFMDAFKYKRPAGYVDLMIAFESRKRAATPYKGNPLNVSLPFSFIDFYKKYKVRILNDFSFLSRMPN